MNISASLPRTQAARPPQQRFDLQTIDTPVEAFLMPGVDLVAGMALGQLGDNTQPATLKMTVGDQTLEYTNRPTENGMEIDGKVNGTPFTLKTRPQADSIGITGQLPGGFIQERLSPVPGGFELSGQAGTIPFQQSFSLDPMAGFTGHVGDLTGNFAGDELKLTLQAKDGGLQATGTLGDLAITETITQGPNGTVLISGQIGEITFNQELARG